ncbi:hypothetical protein ACM26V_13795 [Salipaludibacillus sp. HK11]|uniref:hypothetical protein n=1 Tax=Salipaludibacillus sp. HK11 TaxID=3394320 RepID=UPI0039FD2E8D
MQAAAFTHSVRSASTRNLKIAYVLMSSASITRMISSKLTTTTDVSQRKALFDEYQQTLDKEVELVDFAREELPFEIITVFAQRYNLSLSAIDTQQGLDEFTDKVLTKAIQSYRSINKKFTGTRFEDVVHHFFKKMYEAIGKKYKEATDTEQEELDKTFETFIADLPERQQEQLKHELRISDLSQQTINRIFVSDGSVMLYSALVNTMGFSFYEKGASPLASSANLLGLTMPSTAYTNSASLVSALASPLFFLSINPGSALTKQRSKDNDLMNFLAILLLIFSQDSEEEACSSEEINQRWKTKFAHYQHLLQEINELTLEKSQTTNAIDRYTENKSTFEQKIAIVKKNIAQQHANIANDLQTMSLEKLAEHDLIAGIARQLQIIERDIDSRSMKIVSGQGLIGKIKAGVVNSKNSVLVKERELKRKKLYRDMANLIVSNDVPLFDVESNLISDLKDKNLENQRKFTAVIDKIDFLKEQRKRLTKKYPLLESERKEMIQHYPGIDRVKARRDKFPVVNR